ncbi:hypothetical protein D3C81_2018940 [compost metagenome]
MWRARTKVDFIGPPLVITCTEANTWKEAMIRVMAIRKLVGFRSGTVMERNRCSPVAPSISEASYKSLEMP